MSADKVSDRISAYLAGFFDGEGSVYAASRGGRSKSSDRRPSPTITVCIGNTHKRVLEFHQELFGGSLSARKEKEGWKPQYQWVLCAKQAEIFLRMIRPYVIIKADVVDAALEFIDLQKLPAHERRDYSETIEKNGRKWVTPRMRPEFQERQYSVWSRIRELNARGAPHNVRRGVLALEEFHANEAAVGG